MYEAAIGTMATTERSGLPNRLEYTSDRHPRGMLDMMNLLRQSHELCDVVLNVGSREPIYAHRLILLYKVRRSLGMYTLFIL